MAKGDGTGPVNSPQGVATPKIDQYSVMHKIMDQMGGAGAIGPTPQNNPQPMGSGGHAGSGIWNPGNSAPYFGGGTEGGFIPQPGQQPGQFQFGRFGTGSMPRDNSQPQPMQGGSIAPAQVPEMLRRRMMGNNV